MVTATCFKISVTARGNLFDYCTLYSKISGSYGLSVMLFSFHNRTYMCIIYGIYTICQLIDDITYPLVLPHFKAFCDYIPIE